MEKHPPPPQKLYGAIALIIPLVMLIWVTLVALIPLVVAIWSLFGTPGEVVGKVGVFIASGICWLVAIFRCQKIYKHYGFSLVVVRRNGIIAGSLVTLAAAITMASIIYLAVKAEWIPIR